MEDTQGLNLFDTASEAERIAFQRLAEPIEATYLLLEALADEAKQPEGKEEAWIAVNFCRCLPTYLSALYVFLRELDRGKEELLELSKHIYAALWGPKKGDNENVKR